MSNKIIIFAAFLSGMAILAGCNNQNSSAKTKITEGDSAKSNVQTPIDYLATGKKLAMKTKASLGINLAMALSEKGADGAVEFCNTKAIPITDSMSLLMGAKIKRVSSRPRNPDNQANDAELAYIEKWKEAKANGQEQAPLLSEIDGKMVGYYPITINQMCLQCHGKPNSEIKMATQKKIKLLYPVDRAIGYAENEIRGLFVVEMNKK